jgi:hypothetical protein
MQFQQPAPERDTWRWRRWSQLWALVLLAPAALAVTAMSAAMGAAAIVASFGVATVTALAMTADSVRALPVQLPAAVRFGVCAAVTCLGFVGMFAYSGPLVWAVIAAYVATAAWAHGSGSTAPGQAVAARHEPEEAEEPEEIPQVVTTSEVQRMTDAELCLAWRRSFVTLRSTRNLARRAGVVSLRQVILDEMELRHPVGLRVWLHSGARAAGGPDRFLRRSDETGGRRAA